MVKKKKLYRVTFKGEPLGRILSRTTRRGETLVKPLAQRSDIHLSVYTSESEIRRHITHENKEAPQRHTQKAGVRAEELFLLFLAALAPEDNPPPKVRDFADKEQCRILAEWFAPMWQKASRKAEDRPVRILTGPITNIAELIDGVMTGKIPDELDLDLVSFLEYYGSAGSDGEKEAFAVASETDLKPDGPRVAFSEDLGKIVICVLEGTVLELDPRRLLAAAVEMQGLLGVFDLFRAIDQQGQSLVDERVLQELREWKERHP